MTLSRKQGYGGKKMTFRTKRLNLTVDVNSGSALLFFIGSFFLLLLFSELFPAVEKNFIPALTGLTGSFGGFLVKRNSNNKITLNETLAKNGCNNGTPPVA
jgi:hypothetical protein